MATVAVVGVVGGKTARAATAWPAHVFAPYVDTGLSNTTLTTVAADYGTQFFTLAFVNGSGCQWSLPNLSSWESQISALQAEGGDVSISFGGYTVDTDDTDLGAQCSSAAAMAAQVESVVTTLNVTHLDFDIESNEQYNDADLALTAQALAQVDSWASANGMQLTISYTIPVLPTGLTSTGEGVLTTALANGFTPNIVNIMTMDYGTSGTEMGTAANQALDATAAQLESIYGISSSATYAMLGNTPMIGQNDTSGEIFTLADAATVESYAAQQGIAWLSFWSEAGTTAAALVTPRRRPPAAASARPTAPSPRRSSPSRAAAAAAVAAAVRRPRPRRRRRRRPVRARPPGSTTPPTSRATKSPTTATTGSPTSGTTTRCPAALPAPGTTTEPADG